MGFNHTATCPDCNTGAPIHDSGANNALYYSVHPDTAGTRLCAGSGKPVKKEAA